MTSARTYAEALEEVLAEAKRLLAAMSHYAADFPLDVHHSDVTALDSAVYRAEQARAALDSGSPDDDDDHRRTP